MMPICKNPGCNVTQATIEWKPPEAPNPQCVCGKPLYIYIQPYHHVHPCPVHPSYVVWGSGISW